MLSPGAILRSTCHSHGPLPLVRPADLHGTIRREAGHLPARRRGVQVLRPQRCGRPRDADEALHGPGEGQIPESVLKKRGTNLGHAPKQHEVLDTTKQPHQFDTTTTKRGREEESGLINL